MNYVLTMASAQQRDSRHVTPSGWLGLATPLTCGAAGVDSRQKSVDFVAYPNAIESADLGRTAGMFLLDAPVVRPKGSPPRGEPR